jgi:hypothetical protein
MEVTPEHPLYIEGKGWLKAEAVTAGDRLRRIDGGWAAVLAIERVVLDTPVGVHTYFVLEVGVLVHNCRRVVELGPGNVFRDEPGANRWLQNLEVIKNARPNAIVSGVDIDSSAINLLRRLQESGKMRPDILIREGDFFQLPSNSFDEAIAIAPHPQVLRDIDQVAIPIVRPGGSIYIATEVDLFSKYSYPFYREMVSSFANLGADIRVIHSGISGGNNALGLNFASIHLKGSFYEIYVPRVP